MGFLEVIFLSGKVECRKFVMPRIHYEAARHARTSAVVSRVFGGLAPFIPSSFLTLGLLCEGEGVVCVCVRGGLGTWFPCESKSVTKRNGVG